MRFDVLIRLFMGNLQFSSHRLCKILNSLAVNFIVCNFDELAECDIKFSKYSVYRTVPGMQKPAK